MTFYRRRPAACAAVPCFVLTFLVFLTARTSAVPVVINHSETAQPGDIIYCEGTWGGSIQVKYELVLSTAAPNVSSATSLPPVTSNAGSTHNSGSYVSFQIPATAPVGLYAVWLNDGSGWSTPTFVNQAHGTHCLFSQISPNFIFTIFGRNMILPGYTPSVTFVDTRTSLSYVGTAWAGSSTSYYLQVAAPANIAVGDAYNVIVSNGAGGASGSSQVEEGTTVTWPNGVASPSSVINGTSVPWNLNVPWQADFDSFCNNVINATQAPYNVTAGAYTSVSAQANTVGLQNAMNAASNAGGGVVYLPAGSYCFDCPQNNGNIMYLPPRVVVMGAGATNTILNYGYTQLVNTDEASLFRRTNARTNGLLNLGITNINSAYDQPACTGWGDEWFLQGCILNMGSAASWDCNSSNYILMQNSTLNVSGANAEQMNFHGETGVVIASNTISYNFGRTFANIPGGTSDVVFYNNHFTRNADKSIPNPNHLQGGAVDMYGSRVVFLDNTFDVGAGVTLNPNNNDGEQVLSEFTGAFPTDSGQLTSSTPTTLTDTTKSWASGRWVVTGLSSELTTANSSVVLIVKGPETGQWRYITGSTGNTLTVDHPWIVPPSAGDEYMIENWASNEWLVASNTFSNNLRGIWFGGASVNCVAANNTMTNDDGILIPATQGAAGYFAGGGGEDTTDTQVLNPVWDMQVYNNSISDMPGPATQNPAQLTARLDVVNDYPTLLGTGILGLEVRRNTLVASTPNAGLDGGPIPAENYVNTVIQQFDPTPGSTYGWDLWARPSVYDSTDTGILGSIFQGNASANQTGTYSASFNAANLTFSLTGSAYYLGTGVYDTVIADPIFSNVGATVYDPNGTHFNTVPSMGSVIDYQAEYGTRAGGTNVQTDPSASAGAFTGDFNSTGASCTLTNIDGEAGGAHTLTIRYAVPYQSALDLYVNGSPSKILLSLPSTGGWYGSGHWNTVSVSVPLNPGTSNTLLLKRDAVGNNAANIDKITIN